MWLCVYDDCMMVWVECSEWMWGIPGTTGIPGMMVWAGVELLPPFSTYHDQCWEECGGPGTVLSSCHVYIVGETQLAVCIVSIPPHTTHIGCSHHKLTPRYWPLSRAEPSCGHTPALHQLSPAQQADHNPIITDILLLFPFLLIFCTNCRWN